MITLLNATSHVNPVQQTETTLALLVQRVSDAIAALLTFPRRRAVMQELSQLTDRELADIGLTRDQLKQVFDPRFSAFRWR